MLGAVGRGGIAHRVLTTAAWSVVGEGISRGLVFLTLIWVARTLDPAGYGQFGLVRTTIAMLAGVGGMGLGLTANRFVAQYKEKDSALSGRIVGFSYLLSGGSGLVIGAAAYLMAPYVAIEVLGAPSLVASFRLVAPLLLASAVSGAQVGILQGLQAYRVLALASIAQAIAGVAFIVTAARYAGLTGAVSGLLLQTLLSVVVFHSVIARELRCREIPIIWTGVSTIYPIFWSFSVPVVLTNIAVAPFKWINETLLATRTGFMDLGAFHAAFALTNAIVAVASTLNAPLISALANSAELATSPKGQRLALYGSWYAFLVIASPLLLFPEIPSLAFGPEYAGPRFEAASQLLLLYSGLLLYYQGIIRIIALRGSMWFGFATNLVEGVALAAAFYLLKEQGVVGLAVAYVLSYVARIAVSVPFLFAGRMMARAIWCDRGFIVSLLIIVALVTYRIGEWSP